MALAQDGSILVQVLSTLSNPLDLSTPKDEVRKSYRFPFANGTGADQADEAWHDQRSVAFGATDSLDLSGGLTNVFGAIITMTKVKAIVIRAAAANPNDLEVTMPVNGLPFMKTAADAALLKPGGCFVLIAPAAAGIAVTAGTGDLLNIVNPAGSGEDCIYDIVIIGIE